MSLPVVNPNHRFLLAIVLCGLFAVAAPVTASVHSFRVVANDDRNQVQFTSEATLEKVVGRTTNITGSADIDLQNLRSMNNAAFDVPLGDLDTGIAMRNKEMRAKYLETDKYPRARFQLDHVISADQDTLLPGQTAHLLVEGQFTVHGVTKTYQVPVTLAYEAHSGESSVDPGPEILVTADWTVRLGDHGIVRPAFLFMRLAEEQQVSVSFVMTE
jgi:polyisoprenoid-binding protein YceI